MRSELGRMRGGKRLGVPDGLRGLTWQPGKIVTNNGKEKKHEARNHGSRRGRVLVASTHERVWSKGLVVGWKSFDGERLRFVQAVWDAVLSEHGQLPASLGRLSRQSHAVTTKAH